MVAYEPTAWEPVITRPDWMTEEDQQALLAAVTEQDEPCWLDEGDPDPQDELPPEDYDLREIDAECRQVAEDEARAAATAARLGTTGALAVAAARRGGAVRGSRDQRRSSLGGTPAGLRCSQPGCCST